MENTEGKVDSIDLGSSLDIAGSRELWERLKNALAQSGSVSLNGGDVERADATGLQLLCCFFKDAESTGVKIQWSSVSEALQTSANLIDLSSHLHLD